MFASNDRPAFELKSYVDKKLPESVQLFSLEDLAEHTIKAVVTDPDGELQCDVVFVTETDCWLALGAQMDGGWEDGVSLKVCGNQWRNTPQTLSQYLSVDNMRMANLATPAQLAGLQAIADQKAAQAKARKAEQLRKELADLEGGTT